MDYDCLRCLPLPSAGFVLLSGGLKPDAPLMCRCSAQTSAHQRTPSGSNNDDYREYRDLPPLVPLVPLVLPA